MARVEKPDLCVVGAGPAGIAAAEKGLAAGKRVVLIEAAEMGGVALNWGALPAMVLAASARRAHDIRTAADLAVGAQDPRVNFARLNAHIKTVIGDTAPVVSAERLTAMGADIIRHPAIFIDKTTIEAGERRIKARKVILATGSRPHIPDIPGLAATPFLTPETVFEITRRPGHLIIIGAGATGIVLAQAHRRLGCEVTLIDMLAPLGDHDAEFADIVTARLASEGVSILANTGIVSVAGDEDVVEVSIRRGSEEQVLAGTHVLVATGRVPNLDMLDPTKARIRVDGRGAVLDGQFRTTNRRVYCVGDAAGSRSVAAARHLGAWVAARAMAPGLWPRSSPVMPRLVASDPEIVAVGLTEAEAMARYGSRFIVLRHDFAGLDRARAYGRKEGHVKVMTTADGRLVGAGLCGDGAGEIAGLFALAIAQRLSFFDLADLVVPYPALAQIVPQMAAQYALAHRRPAGGNSLGRIRRLLP